MALSNRMTMRSATVLIVDDDAGLRRALDSTLGSMGYRVLTAGSPDTAYTLLRAEHVDAILLDIGLPTMSGLALHIAITHEWPALEGKIAFITGDADQDDVRAWLEHNPSAVFRKPFMVDQILNWLDAAVAVRQPRRRAARG